MRNALMALAVSLALAPGVYAHEGDVHKILGTVAAIHENHLEVTATNGKKSTIVLNDKTKILKGKTAMKPGDIKVGGRLVVMATEVKGKDGKTSLVAKQVLMGTTSAVAKK